MGQDYIEDCYMDGVAEYLICLRDYDSTRSDDPQKFARTRASYAVKRSAKREALHRERETTEWRDSDERWKTD